MLLSRLAPVLALLGALLAWEVACVVLKVPSFILPRPTQIIAAAQEVPLGTWLENIAATLKIVLAGFCISFVIAIPLAMVLVNSRQLSNTLVPLLVVIQSTPIVAIAPILVVTLGAGISPRVVITCLITFFPLVISTATGLRSAPAELIELSELLSRSPLSPVHANPAALCGTPYSWCRQGCRNAGCHRRRGRGIRCSRQGPWLHDRELHSRLQARPRILRLIDFAVHFSNALPARRLG